MQITVETKVSAPIERVWRAYTTPVDIMAWNAASADWHTTAATVDDITWGSRTALTTPGLITTPGEMAAALDRVAGRAASELIDWIADPAIEAIVGSWPARFDAARARALGLTTNPDIDDVIREFIATHGSPDAA